MQKSWRDDYRIHGRARVGFIVVMSPPDDLDRLSHAELKGLVVKQWEQMVELQRLVAALRDEIARLKGGPGRPNLKPSGMERGTDPKPPGSPGERKRPEGQHAIEACDPRGTDRHGGRPTARFTLQRLHEFRGAGSDDPTACREFPLWILAKDERVGFHLPHEQEPAS